MLFLCHKNETKSRHALEKNSGNKDLKIKKTIHMGNLYI